MMKPSVTDGPAAFAAAAAVRTKRPAPMIAPTPSATSEDAVSVRFRLFSDSAASASSSATGFRTQRLFIGRPAYHETRLGRAIKVGLFTRARGAGAARFA